MTHYSRPAFDHAAFMVDYITPAVLVPCDTGPLASDEDTGLRCYCGREVVATDDSPTGWSHVGIGDRNEPVGGEVH